MTSLADSIITSMTNTNCFININIGKHYDFPTRCIFVLHTVVTINICSSKQHLTGYLCKGKVVCFVGYKLKFEIEFGLCHR